MAELGWKVATDVDCGMAVPAIEVHESHGVEAQRRVVREGAMLLICDEKEPVQGVLPVCGPFS